MAAATIRPLEERDADRAGDVNFVAFHDVALRHGQPPVVTAPADARSYVRHLLAFDPLGGSVAELDGEIVGMAWVHVRGPVATIGPVAVEPRVQGQGIGRQLLERCIELAGPRVPQVRLVQESYNAGVARALPAGGLPRRGAAASSSSSVARARVLAAGATGAPAARRDRRRPDAARRARRPRLRGAAARRASISTCAAGARWSPSAARRSRATRSASGSARSGISAPRRRRTATSCSSCSPRWRPSCTASARRCAPSCRRRDRQLVDGLLGHRLPRVPRLPLHGAGRRYGAAAELRADERGPDVRPRRRGGGTATSLRRGRRCAFSGLGAACAPRGVRRRTAGRASRQECRSETAAPRPQRRRGPASTPAASRRPRPSCGGRRRRGRRRAAG